MDWWREFFDEDYLFLYGPALHPERTEMEVAGATALLRLRQGARVLDVCCGDARHSVPLQRRGFRVVSVDASRSLLRAAQRRAESIAAHPGFVQADARRLPVRAATFDAAVLLFNSIGYGNDQDTRTMLGEIRRALGPQGQLLLECAHRDEHVRRGSAQGPQREWMENHGVRVLTERWIDPIDGIAHAVFRFQRPDGRGVEKHFQHRLYTATEIGERMREAGFQRLDFYGGYDRRAFGLDSPQLVVHGR